MLVLDMARLTPHGMGRSWNSNGILADAPIMLEIRISLGSPAWGIWHPQGHAPGFPIHGRLGENVLSVRFETTWIAPWDPLLPGRLTSPGAIIPPRARGPTH